MSMVNLGKKPGGRKTIESNGAPDKINTIPRSQKNAIAEVNIIVKQTFLKMNIRRRN